VGGRVCTSIVVLAAALRCTIVLPQAQCAPVPASAQATESRFCLQSVANGEHKARATTVSHVRTWGPSTYVFLNEAGSVQHATQQAPEAAAARLRSGAEAPRVKQARRAARRPTLSCAAAGGATLRPARRVGFGTWALAAQLRRWVVGWTVRSRERAASTRSVTSAVYRSRRGP
jgi:hypothetical protein